MVKLIDGVAAFTRPDLFWLLVFAVVCANADADTDADTDTEDTDTGDVDVKANTAADVESEEPDVVDDADVNAVLVDDDDVNTVLGGREADAAAAAVIAVSDAVVDDVAAAVAIGMTFVGIAVLNAIAAVC